MRIALDAMGSDAHPVPDVAGAVLAAQTFGDTIVLVGDEALIQRELTKHATSGLSLEVVHAPEVVTMDDRPSLVGKSKPNSSMHIGMNLVKDGKADAFVTVGNTGAALSIATLYTLKRIPGIKRPALSAIIRASGTSVILLDVGANADSRPDWLVQFAILGRAYARCALAVTNPRVALLSNGEEEGKGNEQVRETAALLKALPQLNYVGNVEPKDMMKGSVDVVVTDGFVGNVFVKTIEASTRTIVSLIRDELMKTVLSKLGALLARPAFERVRKQIDPFEIGGAPLLGVNGIVIVGHGRSNAVAIKNAIGQARSAVNGDFIRLLREQLADEGVQTTEARE